MSISSKQPNYLARHWRGELPLGQALWINGFTVTVTVIIFSDLTLFGRSTSLIDSRTDMAQLAIVVIATLILIPVWQLQGLWRTAERHMEKVGTILAGRSTQMLTILLAIFSITRFSGAAVDFSLIAPMAMKTGIYRTQFTVLTGGRELEIRGGLSFGMAARSAELLSENPSIRRIRLESWGGSLYEAKALAALIEQYKLNTFSGELCSNTCIVPYLAGQHRAVHGPSRLGFTNAYGLPVSAAEILRRHKIPRDFLVLWNQTGSQYWYPSDAQLRDSRIVDIILQPSRQ